MDPVRKRLGVTLEQARQAPTDPVTFARVARAMASLNRAPLTPRLGALCCPALMIVGEKDFLGAGGSVILQRNIAGSQLHIVPSRGHGIFLEDPSGFNALVASFLGSLARSQGSSQGRIIRRL